MTDDDKDHYAEAARSHFDSSAGDDLIGMAGEIAHFRDFVLGVVSRHAAIDGDTVHALACSEEWFKELIAPRWLKCQEALENATDEELDEVDTEWMGKDMPSHFEECTVERLRGMIAKSRTPRTPTNPSTLISMGALDEA